jgi:hypothetical protein
MSCLFVKIIQIKYNYNCIFLIRIIYNNNKNNKHIEKFCVNLQINILNSYFIYSALYIFYILRSFQNEYELKYSQREICSYSTAFVKQLL